MCTHEQWRLHCTKWGCWMPLSSMYTVWSSHSKWLSEKSNESASNFALSLNIPLRKLFGWFRRPQLWAADDWQLYHHTCSLIYHVLWRIFSWTLNHAGDSAPLQPRFGALWLLTWPKTKITFEREKISDHQWDSEKYDGAADGYWENCARSQGSGGPSKVTEVSLSYVQCFLYLVSSSVNVSIFHIPWLDTFWTDHVFPAPLSLWL